MSRKKGFVKFGATLKGGNDDFFSLFFKFKIDWTFASRWRNGIQRFQK
jgi:hypothetical protein